MMNQIFRFSLILLGGSVLLSSGGCKRLAVDSGTGSLEKVPVNVMIVRAVLLTIPVQTTGRLDAKSNIKLSFKTGGIISDIFVNEGSRVERNQKLAQLDLSEIEARAGQAQLAYNKAVRDYQRVRNLYHDSVATLEQLENVRTARDVAYNNLKIARFNVKHSVIRAPAGGRIMKQLAEKDEVIGAGHPVFLFASTEDAWVVRCAIADKDIVRLHLQDSANIKFDVWPGRTFTGQITEMASMADPYSGTYPVEITLDSAGVRMVSGLLASVTLFPSDTLRALTVPFRSLSGADLLEGTVYTVSGGRARSVMISIERMLDSLCIVSRGLTPGDTVITDGLENVDDGAALKIINILNRPEP